MVKVSLDIGFGDLKCAVSDNGEITEIYKDTLSYVQLPSDENMAVKYDDKDYDIVRSGTKVYRIGESAKFEADKKVIDVLNYKTMKEIAPLVVKKYLRKYPTADEILVSLSLAFADKQDEFTEYVKTETGVGDKIRVLPQSAMAKVALDRVGLDLSNPSPCPYPNYLLLDVGFNTVDVCKVINSRTTPSDRKGHEGQGVVKLATYLIDQIKQNNGVDLPLTVAREILYKGFYEIRGVKTEVKNLIDEGIKAYLNELYKFIEQEYGAQLNMMPKMILVGGGAELIKTHIDFFNNLYNKEFAVIPADRSEFYNAIGALFV